MRGERDVSQESVFSDAGSSVSEDHLALVEGVLAPLGQATRCSAAGLLLVEGQYGQMILLRSRPVDDLFLQAMRHRLVSSYQVSVGMATREPEIDVFVYGDTVSGPYEPPRSALASPILCAGRVVGTVGVASVFPEAFRSRDLCVLSEVAAHVSSLLEPSYDPGENMTEEGEPLHAEWDDAALRRDVRSSVRQYVTSICGLARQWQAQDVSPLPRFLCQDLDEIAENALQIRELLVR
jgi:hypothetical protein